MIAPAGSVCANINHRADIEDIVGIIGKEVEPSLVRANIGCGSEKFG